jgi:hypothetical protein
MRRSPKRCSSNSPGDLAAVGRAARLLPVASLDRTQAVPGIPTRLWCSRRHGSLPQTALLPTKQSPRRRDRLRRNPAAHARHRTPAVLSSGVSRSRRRLPRFARRGGQASAPPACELPPVALVAICETDDTPAVETCNRPRAGARCGHIAWLPTSDIGSAPAQSAARTPWLLRVTDGSRTPSAKQGKPAVKQLHLRSCKRSADESSRDASHVVSAAIAGARGGL